MSKGLTRNYAYSSGYYQRKPLMLRSPRRSHPTISPQMSLGQSSKSYPAEREEAPKKADKTARVSKSLLNYKIRFTSGNARLTYRTMPILRWVARKICRDFSHIKKIVITGHTDSSQWDNFKEKLSRQRAIAVADYLVKRCRALTYNKLEIKSEADRKPIASNNTKTGRAKNRRVEIKIIKN